MVVLLTMHDTRERGGRQGEGNAQDAQHVSFVAGAKKGADLTPGLCGAKPWSSPSLVMETKSLAVLLIIVIFSPPYYERSLR